MQGQNADEGGGHALEQGAVAEEPRAVEEVAEDADAPDEALQGQPAPAGEAEAAERLVEALQGQPAPAGEVEGAGVPDELRDGQRAAPERGAAADAQPQGAPWVIEVSPLVG